MKTQRVLFGVIIGLVATSPVVTAQPLPNAPAERCAPIVGNTLSPTQWLDRAAARVIPASAAGQVLRYTTILDIPLVEQSDRPYEPFIPSSNTFANWVDVTSGTYAQNRTERATTHAQYPDEIDLVQGAFVGRDTVVQAVPQLLSGGAIHRRFDPWVTLIDWRSHAADARVVERCIYRGYPRVVLERAGERLYLTESDGVPIKIERIEPHYLWGQVKAEYLWGTWWGVRGGGLFPAAAFRIFDGTLYERAGVRQQRVELIPADSAPKLTIPDNLLAPQSRVEAPAESVDTVRVTQNTFLLVTRAYTETVTLARDTVFLLDATSSEARSRADSVWISKLFPGKHPVVVVVTDLAWPHISGVRFWVAHGATIVSHATSEDMLRRVVNRKWTLTPDALERVRATAKFQFRAVTDSMKLAGGAITAYAMRGNTTEGALAVWHAGDRFLWAGDYIQGGAISPYYYDVVTSVRAFGIRPEKTAAQHVKLMDWATVDNRVPKP